IVEQAGYKEDVEKRIKVMYEYGDSGYIDVLLEADNLMDFFTRMEYLTQILNYDDNMFEKLENIQIDIEEQKAQLELEGASLDHLKAEADLQKNQLEDLYIEKNIQVDKLQNDKEMRLAQIAEQEAERAEIDKQIQIEIEKEKERIRKANKKKLIFSDGEFKWPVEGYYTISSPFQTRISPITGREEHHNGLDIPAPKGTEVRAAASGYVVLSYKSSSYGNVVIISHGTNNGKDYVTLYAHNSKNLVNKGDAIVKGDLIALVGSTGWSTGNHSHFGVQIDGVWVNPARYFNY
ncbi:MAG: peptidoglycan DD-metalloendopeptidase family protein, partial [Vallitaleaceae bacterium]|nr:peptidoglycan DD-metalloendopeptidase family protein [Vallitaleaceae bacterium]